MNDFNKNPEAYDPILLNRSNVLEKKNVKWVFVYDGGFVVVTVGL